MSGQQRSSTPAARSVSIEDYVKVIYTHTEWQPVPITGSILATRLALSPSSVTEMVQKLRRLGLVDHAPYGAISLTEPGRTLAVEMVRRHRLLETYLVEALGYSWDEVHDEAEVLEHVISPLLLERIDLKLGRPRRDPHGDPIPDADGVVHRRVTTVLDNAAVGSTGRVSRISDADPDLLIRLADQGLTLDREVTVTARGPGGTTTIRRCADGVEIELAEGAGGAIWLDTDSLTSS